MSNVTRYGVHSLECLIEDPQISEAFLVHAADYDALRARLAVADGIITAAMKFLLAYSGPKSDALRKRIAEYRAAVNG